MKEGLYVETKFVCNFTGIVIRQIYETILQRRQKKRGTMQDKDTFLLKEHKCRANAYMLQLLTSPYEP